jgi:hypothetical protein
MEFFFTMSKTDSGSKLFTTRIGFLHSKQKIEVLESYPNTDSKKKTFF